MAAVKFISAKTITVGKFEVFPHSASLMNNGIQNHRLHTTPYFYQQAILAHYSTGEVPAKVSCHAVQFLPLKTGYSSCLLSFF
jgi:hypothetical protein